MSTDGTPDEAGDEQPAGQSTEDEASPPETRLERLWAWAEVSDVRLLLVVAGAIYLLFGALSLLLGLGISGAVGTFERITFFAVVYALAVLALNLQWGYAGLFNIGIAGFMAIGLYTMAVLTAPTTASPPGLGLPYPVGVVIGVLVAGLFGALVALPALRLRADYLAIVTLAFAEIVRRTFELGELAEFSIGGVELGFGGPTGLRTLPHPVQFLLYEDPYSSRPDPNAFGDVYISAFEVIGVRRTSAEGILYAIFLLIVVALFYALLQRMGKSPYGRVLKAIREDEVVARALGKNTRWFKVQAFALGSALMGLAAILWFLHRGGITPSSFDPEITFFIFVALIIGGAGSNTGSVIGGFVFGAVLWQGPMFVQRAIRHHMNVGTQPETIFDAFTGLEPFLSYFVAEMAAVRIILMGVLLTWLIQRRPEGLLGHRKEIAASVDLGKRSENE